MESRREFGKVALAALSMSSVLPFSDLLAAKKLNSTVEGVRLGMTTASLNPLDVSPGKDPMDTVVFECIDVGAANIELYANFIEPRVPGGGVGGQVPAKITPEYSQGRDQLPIGA